jgi:hypothetical protein
MIQYRSGFHFQLMKPYQLQTSITEACLGNPWVNLSYSGLLSISAGYAWDGASGPIPQSRQILRGSLVHDAFYQLIREHSLSQTWRKPVDQLFRQILLEDGLPSPLASLSYHAVRLFGGRFTQLGRQHPTLIAP